MRDLSLHLLDIVQNSVRAGAQRVSVRLEADQYRRLTMEVIDDGCGMTAEFAARVTDPFVTTRTTRKVGLGIPLLREMCLWTGGDLSVESAPGVGTHLTAVMGIDPIDRLPLGSLASTIRVLIAAGDEIDYQIELISPERSFMLDLREVRTELGDVPMTEPEVLDWIAGVIEEAQLDVFAGILPEHPERTERQAKAPEQEY